MHRVVAGKRASGVLPGVAVAQYLVGPGTTCGWRVDTILGGHKAFVAPFYNLLKPMFNPYNWTGP